MKNSELLMIPGPTPLPEPVRSAIAAPAIGHRSLEFKEVLKRVLPNLQKAFKTQQPVLLYTASGTGAIEAAMINTLNAGDKVLVLIKGVFSGKWAELSKTLGYHTDVLEVPHGQAHTPDLLESFLEKNRDCSYSCVFMTHSETSTGALSPVMALTKVVRKYHPEALVMVDAVTSLVSAQFEFDDWDIDIAVSGSQKGFMVPPGLSFLALSERALKAHQQCVRPSFYFNFAKTLKAQAEFNTPYTPATHTILGLDVSLLLILEEGLDAITVRHYRNRQMVRAGLSAMGLKLFVSQDDYASYAVTSFLPPEKLSVADIRAGLKTDFGIIIADGQQSLKGKILRIGHLGYIGQREILTTLGALESVLINLGCEVTPGSGVAAATSLRFEGKEVLCV
ncbi:MAG: alanine--glyoxylate aminotransferase family protein [Cyanobacteria bacterium P01_H01_bin.74]